MSERDSRDADQGETNSNDGAKSSNEPIFTEGTPSYAVNALEGLIKKIAEGNAIVYVGAGVSQSAGLPSWDKLLEKLLEEAETRLENQNLITKAYFEELKRKSRNLEVGEWLLRLLGPEFHQVISSALAEGDDLCEVKPSIIHWNLVRSPFRMAITTNYDLLLESAYDSAYRICPQKLPYLTWKHTDEILRASARNRFRIVHAHGTVGDNNSIVLSASQYTMLHTTFPRFEDVMKGLLKNQTILFVGAGLEDPDLIFELQEAVAENGGAVGPHYALLPYGEAPQIRRDILRESLHVEVIPVGNADFPKQHEENEKKRAKEYATGRAPQEKTHWMTAATGSILRAIAGRVARRKTELGISGYPTSDDPTFCLESSLRVLLKHAIEITGSTRGDICLSPDGIDSHLSGELKYELSAGVRAGEASATPVPPDSICGIAYYESSMDEGVYVGNVNAADLALEIFKKREEIYKNRKKLRHFGNIQYVRGDETIQSELALPIGADGVRVGVLNLESNLLDGYGDDAYTCDDFRMVAKRFAEKAGRLYAAAHERDRRGVRLAAEDIERDEVYGALRSICGRIWRIARWTELPDPADVTSEKALPDLVFVVYRAHFRKGELQTQDPMKTVLKGRQLPKNSSPIKPLCFPFHTRKDKNKYMATRVFLDGRPYYYPSAAHAIAESKITNPDAVALGLSCHLDENGRARKEDLPKDIAEPIIGFPVLIQGHAAGSIVAWHYREPEACKNGVDPRQYELDGRDIELFRRVAHLMTNDFRWRERTLPKNDGVSAEGADGESKKLVRISKVEGVLNCITRTTAELSGNVDELNDVGIHYREQVGAAVLEFLTAIGEQEREFRALMRAKHCEPPEDWVSPTRCRCWIRSKAVTKKSRGSSTSPDMKPTFALAFQLTLRTEPSSGSEKEQPATVQQMWKNRFSVKSKTGRKKTWIAMQPLESSLQGDLEKGDPSADDPRKGDQGKNIDESPMQAGQRLSRAGKIQINGLDGIGTGPKPAEIDVEILDGDPHLSFLLSRIGAYPYAFQQKPQLIGPDVMAEILNKDPSLPWYVAPMIVGWKDQWKDDGAAEEAAGGKNLEYEVEGHFVGYLNFDSEPQVAARIREQAKEQRAKGKQPRSLEMKEDWAKFQNDLLHQMALFGACLAHHPCLQQLVVEGS